MHILKCLGAAVLLRWNDLPTHIQRELFEHSVVHVEPREIAMLKDQIARFLHKHKDDSRHRKMTGYAVPLGRESAQP